MRIAIVMPRGSQFCRTRPNSMETVALTLLEHSRLRDQTEVVCDAGATDPALPNLITVPSDLGKNRRAEAVAEILDGLGATYVEYHQQLESSARLARRLPGRIHVLYRHTRIKPCRSLLDRIRYGARLSAFDRIVFVSETARAEFAADYPRFAAKASAVCNPIDTKAWTSDPADRDDLILFSGRAIADKGLEPLCQALEIVLDRFPAWKAALMLGDWDRHSEWAMPRLQPLERFGTRVAIHKSASLEAVQRVTRRAAIAVTPSLIPEALGLSALEAHAAGAALISSGRGGLREASGPNAIYVEYPQATTLAEAMTTLIQNPSVRIALGRAGQSFVATQHSPAKRSAELDDLRETLLQQLEFER